MEKKESINQKNILKIKEKKKLTGIKIMRVSL